MQSLPKPRAIIFDWDNTLVDTWPVIHEALNRTYADMGKPLWTFDQTRERVKKSMRDSFPEIFGENWEQAAILYQGYYRSSHLEALKPLEGAKDVLEAVRSLGLFCAVVSNKKGPVLREEVEHIGWKSYFSTIIGADDAARDKPHADPVHLAFAQTHIKPAPDVWFVGDSEVDIACAEATGCTALLYGPVARTHESYTDTHYFGFPFHHHVDDHEGLLALLKA